MEKFIIKKSSPLKGAVKIGGSKNSVLPILAATLLVSEECIINEVPRLSDVFVMLKLLESFGARVRWIDDSTLSIDNSRLEGSQGEYDLATKMRASFLVMGPLLARVGSVKIPLPGGCAIGGRPVDLHLKGFSALGAKIENEHGFVSAEIEKGTMEGANVYLDFPSVGATENIIMAAVFAKGQTVIENCAIEPEIVDLSNFLNSCGAIIKGSGTDTIKVTGVTELRGCKYTVIPDRIEAGTFMLAAAVTGGDVTCKNVVIDHLKPIIAKLKETNVKVLETDEGGVRVIGTEEILNADLKTLPYPGFPTDMQPQFMSLLAMAKGTSVVTETIFENRFMHVGQLKRMGAKIKIESRSAILEGVDKLMGTQVKATDLRAGAALVLSALIAEGETELDDIFHIDRGYYLFDKKLQALGAIIERR